MKVLLLILYALLVAYLSLRPSAAMPDVEHVDKLVHFGAYCLFAVLGLIASRNQGAFYAVCLVIILYGGLLEVVQHYLPYRQMSFYDFVANLAGVMAGALFATIVRRYIPATE